MGKTFKILKWIYIEFFYTKYWFTVWLPLWFVEFKKEICQNLSLVRLKLVEEAECQKKSQVLINEPILWKVQNLY